MVGELIRFGLDFIQHYYFITEGRT